MQVSWIDADRLKALLEQIAPPEQPADSPPVMVEIETAPEDAASWGAITDWGGASVVSTPVEEIAEVAPPTFSSPEPPEEEPEQIEAHEEHGHALHNPAAALPLSRIRDKLRAIRQRATEAGILTRGVESLPKEGVSAVPAPVQTADVISDSTRNEESDRQSEVRVEMSTVGTADVPCVPAFEIPPGSREERLAAFAGWAKQLLHEDGGHVLVMSDDGEVLWGGEAKAGLVLSTMMAWGAAIRASASSACETPPVIRQRLASGHVLTVIPCDTTKGVIHAAVAAPVGLADEVALLLRGALSAAMRAV